MRFFAAACSLLLVAACEVTDPNTLPVGTALSQVTEAEQASLGALLSRNLRDPASVQFRGWQAYNLSNGDRAICGEMNGKNAYGGYVGFEPFYLRMRGGAVIASQTVDAYAAEACRQAASGQMSVNPEVG